MQRASYRKHHFVYKTTCTATGRFYFGLHSTDDLEDGYLGSGVRLGRSIKKYGRSAHNREIVKFFPTRKEASDFEETIITEEIRQDPSCMNCGPGGLGFTDRPATKETTKEKLSAAGTTRWTRDRDRLQQELEDELKNFTMSREQILEALLTKDGQLNKNITRHLANPEKRKGQDGMLNRVAKLNTAKWRFIHSAIQNPAFGDDAVELINAYVLELARRPTCKTCGGAVSFFRFRQPYATYCGNSCQLLDPDFRNPVWSRYK